MTPKSRPGANRVAVCWLTAALIPGQAVHLPAQDVRKNEQAPGTSETSSGEESSGDESSGDLAALTAAVDSLCENVVDQRAIAELIQLDGQLAQLHARDVSAVRRRLLGTLAAANSGAGVQHVRAVFERDAEARDEAAEALATRGLTRSISQADWQYLVRSLTVVHGTGAGTVLRALSRSPRRATKPTWIRRVILLGLTLDESGQARAVSVLQHWTGTKTPPGETAAQSLAGFQRWFGGRYPDEPPAIAPVDAADAKWQFADLLRRLQSVKTGDAAAGRKVFTKARCDQCHRLGDLGETVGPDLSSLGWRRQQREILEATLFPSHVLDEEYPSVAIVTATGKTLNGMLASGADGNLVVVDTEGKRTTLSRDDIDQIKPLQVSAMPAGLLEPLTWIEIRDLFAFLVSGQSRPEHAGSVPAGRE